MKHWEQFPPVRGLVAAFIGFKPEPIAEDKNQITTAEAAEAIARAFNSSGVGRR